MGLKCRHVTYDRVPAVPGRCRDFNFLPIHMVISIQSFWPQILLKNKFWNLGEKTIPKNSHMSRLLKTRTSTSFILQALPWQHAEEPNI